MLRLGQVLVKRMLLTGLFVPEPTSPVTPSARLDEKALGVSSVLPTAPCRK
jgi:hypothetical protein